MITWASIVVLITALAAFLADDLTSLLTGAAELAVVIALFALVCAAESVPTDRASRNGDFAGTASRAGRAFLVACQSASVEPIGRYVAETALRASSVAFQYVASDRSPYPRRSPRI